MMPFWPHRRDVRPRLAEKATVQNKPRKCKDFNDGVLGASIVAQGLSPPAAAAVQNKPRKCNDFNGGVFGAKVRPICRSADVGAEMSMRRVEPFASLALAALLAIGVGPAAAQQPHVAEHLQVDPTNPAAPKTTAAEYFQILVHQLAAQKRFPLEAIERKMQGTAQVLFTIDRNGRLLSRRLMQSSGYDILDREALAQIERSQPFPAPPQSVGGDSVTFTIPIRFNIAR